MRDEERRVLGRSRVSLEILGALEDLGDEIAPDPDEAAGFPKADDVDALAVAHRDVAEHEPKSSTDSLLGEDVRLGRVRSEADHHRHVLHIPALAKHEDTNNRVYWICRRIDFTGKTPFEMQSIHALPRGFRIVFTRPVSPQTASDPKSYRIEHYRYEHTGAYGSPELDRTNVAIEKIVPHIAHFKRWRTIVCLFRQKRRIKTPAPAATKITK